MKKEVSEKIGEVTEEDTGCPRFFWWWFFTFFLPIQILGILMVIIGQSNLDTCPDSWLPTWLLVAGVGILSYTGLAVTYACSNSWGNNSTQARSETETNKPCSWIRIIMSVDLLFGFVWHCIKCYWTWTSVHHALHSDSKQGRDSEDSGCSESVLWFSLVMTILPLAHTGVMLCLCCVCRCRKAAQSNSV